jgi:ADP-heptose:LPS heptosyltransferase
MFKKIRRPLYVFFNFVQYIISRILFLLIRIHPQVKKPRTLLFIRLDAIGDYILAHDFFPYVRNSEQYKDYTITLCANVACRTLIEHYDRSLFDEIIWVNRGKYHRNPLYRYRIFKKIYESGFEVAIESTYSREILFGDSIVYMSNASEKIGCTGSQDGSKKSYREMFSDKYYTKLLPSSEQNLFEFLRNKEFFENLLHVALPVTAPSLDKDITPNPLPGEKYVVVVTGAQEKIKMWHIDNFARVVEYFLQNTDYKVVFTGGANETERGEYLKKLFNDERILNYCGKTTLPEYIGLIANARLVVSNDTSAVHVAAAFQVPLVCPVKGTRFGRFHPYPEGMFPNSRFVYPKEIEIRWHNQEYLLKKYRYASPLHINSIKAEQVIAAIQELKSIF